MKKLIQFLVILFAGCFGLGFIVSKLEKKGGWVKGHKPYGPYEKHFKRPLDFGLSLFAIILFWPILLIIAIAVKVNMGSPVVFEQERPGLGGKLFTLKKFRTMTEAKDAEGNPLPDAQRLNKAGRLIRESSADETLETFNILKGNMSIVGPRPLLVEYLPYYTKEERHRHDVRPGLTGLAQVSGRNLLGWDERIAKDIEYVNNISFLMDLKIVAMTVKNVFTHSGASADTSKTETNFADERRRKAENEEQN